MRVDRTGLSASDVFNLPSGAGGVYPSLLISLPYHFRQRFAFPSGGEIGAGGINCRQRTGFDIRRLARLRPSQHTYWSPLNVVDNRWRSSVSASRGEQETEWIVRKRFMNSDTLAVGGWAASIG